jgi:hypothetical protein
LIGPALWCLLPFAIAIQITTVAVGRGHYYLAPVCHLAGATVLTLSMPVLVAALGPPGGVLAAGLGLATAAGSISLVAARRGWLAAGRTLGLPLLCILGATAAYRLVADISAWLALCAGLLVLAGLAWWLGVVSRADRRLAGQLVGRSRE